jgi:hypothetical protein
MRTVLPDKSIMAAVSPVFCSRKITLRDRGRRFQRRPKPRAVSPHRHTTVLKKTNKFFDF